MVRTIIEPLYSTTATVTGGRSGHARSDDGLLDVVLTGAKEMGGPGTGTNPEQLFAAGYAACFQSAMSNVGRSHKIDTSASTIDATVTLGKADDSGFGLAVTLSVTIPGVDHDTTMMLLNEAHKVCPYSRAVEGNVAVTLQANS